jgi:glycosyltransferase involved in cell wall biosynthesis
MEPHTQAAQMISVLIPVGPRVSDLQSLYDGYRQALEASGCPYEFIFVLDGPMPAVAQTLETLQSQHPGVMKVIRLARSFGESAALMVAFEQSVGATLLTLPAYHQIAPAGIAELLAGLADADMAVARRWPRAGSKAEHIRRSLFHNLLSPVTGSKFRDLGCGARAFRRDVLNEITLYGDQHRFLPVLAVRQGFRVHEVDTPQAPEDINPHGYRMRDYLYRALDIFTVFFLVRFTKKPLRFFGMVGALMFALGVILILYVSFERLFLGVALAERPALLISSLLAVLGLQLLAIGLLGELMIFTHARDIKEYQVAEVVQTRENLAPGSDGKPDEDPSTVPPEFANTPTTAGV